MKQNTYKLKTKKIGQWELPIKDILLNKIEQGEDLGGRRIKYVKGGKVFGLTIYQNLQFQKKFGLLMVFYLFQIQIKT